MHGALVVSDPSGGDGGAVAFGMMHCPNCEVGWSVSERYQGRKCWVCGGQGIPGDVRRLVVLSV